ncbi:MAG: methyltransferase [Nitrospirota bacterium]
MYVITLVLFVLCFGSFAWAMYGGFFLVSSRMSDWAIILRLVSGACAVCHVVALLTVNHVVHEWLMAASLLYLISLLLFWSALVTNKRIPLFHCFTELVPDHIVTHGPYKHIRHPFYTSYTCAWVAGVIATQQQWLWGTVFAMCFLYWKAASREEAEFLNSPLSAAYRAYMLQTGFMWPPIFGRKPETPTRV